MQDIINLITKNLAKQDTQVENNQVDPVDMKNIIMPNMCVILGFYSIASDACPDNALKLVDANTTIKADNASGIAWWKILIIVFACLVGVFIILVIIFAIKAKMNQQEENEETPPETSS